ncbi:tape measure protein [Oceanobacillus jeddahense]|uniref:tape measure protein n=1 Tax=Oceanobacillus jeddahense TaxID=1462527 RepID=UPI00363628E4
MAELLKGLSIDLDLDTIKLDRGLKGVKDSIKTVNSEMKANMSAFDRSDRSVGKYETRLEGLNKKLDVQKEVVKEAKAEHENMVKEFGEGSKEAEKAAREYNNQAAQLNNLERYIERTKDELIELKKEQEIANSNWTKIGNSFEGFGGKLQGIGSKMKDVGGQLTKRITLPAMAAVTAVGGITAAFGWSRLVGLDSAQAQLRGLGYEADDVERISANLVEALDGGMMTMAEATSAAATAMAAGVEEGDELARYIQILDSAVVGGTGSFAEMEQIFGRIVDQGKMTRGEFDMISQRMPGFSSAVQEAMNVSSEEMYEMLRNGEITTDQFLDIMENFAGDMATEYSKSWEGMVQNTKAYIGIIGESLLGGVFEKSKESIAEFIELLKSDAVMDWAAETGEKIGDAFSKVVDSIKSGIEWFMNLESSQQKLIGSFGGLVVAMGPILTVGGLLIGWIGKFMLVLSPLMKAIGKAGGLIKFLAGRFSFLLGPVGIVLGLITTLATGFTIAYKKSDTFRGFIDKLKDAFITAYEKVKEFLTTNESFLGFIDSIKNGFNTAKDLIMDAFGIAMDFVKDKISEIKKFWDSNGSQLLQAFQNIWGGIQKVVEPIIDALVSAVKFAFPYIKTTIEVALKVAFEVVKMIWTNIKGVINGALDVIMGGIKIFSGLFTGDWSKMWEGIKQALSGAVQFIWNFIQLSFFGRVLKGGIAFVKSFAGFFSSMWQGIRTTFSNVIKWIVEFVKNRFTSMGNTISNLTTGIQNILSRIWNFIWDGIIKPIIRGIVDFVRTRFQNMRDTTSNIFTRIRDTAQNLWNAVKDKIWNPVKNIVQNVKDRFGNLKDGISTTFRNIRDNVSDWIGRMVQNVKDMPGKMADGIKKTIGKVKTAFGNIGNAMISTLRKGVNGVIGGINWVLEKLGIDYRVPTWKSKAAFGGVASSIVGYAHGTDGHPEDGPAWIGDGRGRNAGRELVRLPNGEEFLSPAKPTLMPNMPKGTQVLSALDTKELFKNIPAYSNGIGTKIKDIAGSVWDGMKDFATDTVVGAKKTKDVAFDVWDYVHNPSKLLNKALEFLGVYPQEFIGAFKQVPVKGFEMVKDGGVKYLKKKIDDMFGSAEGISMGPGLAGVTNWSVQIRRAAAQMGEKVTAREVQGILAQIQRESGGNQRIVQSSAVWDINMANNNPARGLLQYIPQTFNAYKVKGFGNIYDGYHQLLAFFNNRTWRRDLPYGRRGWGPRGGRKYKQGTNYVPEDGPAYLHKGEAVIPAAYNRPAGRTEAMKLLALAGKQIAKNNSPNQQSNPGVGNSAGIEYLESMVSLLSQQVDDLKQIILLLTQLVAKNPNLQIGEHEFKTFISNLTDKGLNEIGNKKKNAWGGA